MRRAIWLGLGTAAMVALLMTALVGQAAEPKYKTQRFLGHGTLSVPYPATWKAVTRAEPGMPPTTEFAPPSGDDFRIVLTAFPPGPGHEDALTTRALRETLDSAGQKALAQAVEKKLEIKELERSENPGFYFTVTDRDPKGSYPYLTQAYARVGTVVAMVSILQRSTEAGPREQGLAMIRGARLEK